MIGSYYPTLVRRLSYCVVLLVTFILLSNSVIGRVTATSIFVYVGMQGRYLQDSITLSCLLFPRLIAQVITSRPRTDGGSSRGLVCSAFQRHRSLRIITGTS